MINRAVKKSLIEWKNSTSSLPLILRGARQVGKTTLIDELGKEYDQYLYFNLEKREDKELFEQIPSIDKLVQLLFISRGYQVDPSKRALLFIDEIQENPAVIESLRFFKEDFPTLDVIVTGSLLEFGLNKVTKIPVGRVEFMELHPLNFREYLDGSGQQGILEILKDIPIDNAYNQVIFKHFHDFALVGGMPGIISTYFTHKDITRVANLYASIIEAYKEDVEKYAARETQRKIIRHIMDTAPYEIDNRIKLHNFGSSDYRAREVKEAIGELTKARLLELVYPTTMTEPPLVPNFKKRPRLHFLDIGLVNYQLGLHKELLMMNDLHQISKGKLIQQLVNQEIKSLEYLPGGKRAFWVREEGGTSSEVDIIYPYRNMLIPIEVKSGASGAMRSLREFMERCPHGYAVRLYAGAFGIDQLVTLKGKKYKLLNLPYFLSAWLPDYLDWFCKE